MNFKKHIFSNWKLFKTHNFNTFYVLVCFKYLDVCVNSMHVGIIWRICYYVTYDGFAVVCGVASAVASELKGSVHWLCEES